MNLNTVTHIQNFWNACIINLKVLVAQLHNIFCSYACIYLLNSCLWHTYSICHQNVQKSQFNGSIESNPSQIVWSIVVYILNRSSSTLDNKILMQIHEGLFVIHMYIMRSSSSTEDITSPKENQTKMYIPTPPGLDTV